jgi:hypothetical protein
MPNMFPFKAMKETHEPRKTKIDIDEFRSGTTNITIFCMNGLSYKKNKKWTSPVQVQLNSTCTDDRQLMNYLTSASGKRTEF